MQEELAPMRTVNNYQVAIASVLAAGILVVICEHRAMWQLLGPTNSKSEIHKVPTSQGSSWCHQLLLSSSSSSSSSSNWDGPSKLPPEVPIRVQRTLRRHCMVNPDLHLEQLLPNMTLFTSIHDTLQAYRNDHNASIALIAGRGATATRTITDLIANKMDYARTTLHFIEVRCRNHTVSTCMMQEAKRLVEDYFQTDQYQVHLRDNPWVGAEDYSCLHHHLDMSIQQIFRCGDCGNIVISDLPWLNLFAEFYLSLGPETKVILSRRDARSWTETRQKAHGRGYSKTGFICSDMATRVTTSDSIMYDDPFSYTQCKGYAQDVTKVEPAILSKAMIQHTHYIHSLVPADYLLDINLFTGSIFEDGDSAISTAWSEQTRAIIQYFLGNHHRRLTTT